MFFPQSLLIFEVSSSMSVKIMLLGGIREKYFAKPPHVTLALVELYQNS